MNPHVARAWLSVAPRPGATFSPGFFDALTLLARCWDAMHRAGQKVLYLPCPGLGTTETNSFLTPVFICPVLSHPAPLFEADLDLKLTARHESLLYPCACCPALEWGSAEC